MNEPLGCVVGLGVLPRSYPASGPTCDPLVGKTVPWSARAPGGVRMAYAHKQGEDHPNCVATDAWHTVRQYGYLYDNAPGNGVPRLGSRNFMPDVEQYDRCDFGDCGPSHPAVLLRQLDRNEPEAPKQVFKLPLHYLHDRDPAELGERAIRHYHGVLNDVQAAFPERTYLTIMTGGTFFYPHSPCGVQAVRADTRVGVSEGWSGTNRQWFLNRRRDEPDEETMQRFRDAIALGHVTPFRTLRDYRQPSSFCVRFLLYGGTHAQLADLLENQVRVTVADMLTGPYYGQWEE